MTNTITYNEALLRLFELDGIQDADVQGVVRCYCGCKYWENENFAIKCIDCGQSLNAELIEGRGE